MAKPALHHIRKATHSVDDHRRHTRREQFQGDGSTHSQGCCRSADQLSCLANLDRQLHPAAVKFFLDSSRMLRMQRSNHRSRVRTTLLDPLGGGEQRTEIRLDLLTA